MEYNRNINHANNSASERDYKKIEILKSKYNLDDPDDVEKVYLFILSGAVKFESKIGNDFDDEICALRDKLKKEKTNLKSSSNNSNSVIKNKKTGYKDFDELSDEMKDKVRKEMHKRDVRRVIIISILLLLASTFIGYFAFYYYNIAESEKRFGELADLKGSDALLGENNTGSISANIVLEDGTIAPPILEEYLTLYNSNQKLIGWIKIDDTNIDYPVMQCEDNEFYLSHNFDSEEDKAGALFLDYNNNVLADNDNYIIYGHHLSNGKMFASLENYESESYYNSHKYIRFDTIFEPGLYQVMYAFRSRVYNEDEVVFKYYQFIDANSEEEFYSYMDEMESIAFYDTGVRAVYGDTLLTLSTCDYQETNGRFVVVAKRIG